jgi:N-sulfoglucosamine sulfohydrolase
LIRNLLPNTTNPGHAFTIDRFVGEAEFLQALERAPERVRTAYQAMARPPEYELYDLAADPYEFSNIASDPAHQDAFERLKARLQQWREQTNDPFLDPANTARLKGEIESTFKDGKYERPEGWNYNAYLAPDQPASSATFEN